MDQNYSTTDTLHKKGAHLTFEERVIIQTRLRDNQSYRSIAREIGCCVNTVRNEVKRGKVLCYNGKKRVRERKKKFGRSIDERKTRCSLIRKLPNKESAPVIEAFRKLKDGMFRDCFSRVFLSITTDNGSEFSSLSELEKLSHTRIYYALPYCSSDKGTNENHNGLFRRFLPKGKKIHDYPWNTFPE